eukprot:SAG31_NODE_25008_length_470_cov_0.579515_1_plen_95_part_10
MRLNTAHACVQEISAATTHQLFQRLVLHSSMHVQFFSEGSGHNRNLHVLTPSSHTRRYSDPDTAESTEAKNRKKKKSSKGSKVEGDSDKERKREK